MEAKEYTHPDQLERYSFLWSEARLVIAAISLLAGATPVALRILPYALYSTTTSFLVLAWIVSGATSAYLLYRWNANGKILFGKKDALDMIAFLASAISGINLGLTGLIRQNIGMSIFSNSILFSLAGLIYLAAAIHLYMKWSANGQRIF